MNVEEWKQECVTHPYYTYYTAYEASIEEGKRERPVGGKYDGESNICSPNSLFELWDSSDLNVQYTLNALKEITGETTLAGVKEKLTQLEVIDFRPYHDIRDLRPLTSRNYEVTQAIYLPEGAQVNSLWALQSKLEVLDAPNVKVTGTRPEDCPTESYIFINNAVPVDDYPDSVVNFCKSLKD